MIFSFLVKSFFSMLQNKTGAKLLIVAFRGVSWLFLWGFSTSKFCQEPKGSFPVQIGQSLI